MADIELSKDDRNHLIRQMQKILREDLDIEAGNMETGFVLDRLIPLIGHTYYNRGLRDAAAIAARRADDIADDLYAMEKSETAAR